MASIIWTIGAWEDLRGIVGYIGRNSTAYAAQVAGRIVSAVERLRRHPKLGRVVPEYEDETIQELIVGNYRVVRRVSTPPTARRHCRDCPRKSRSSETIAR